MMYKDPSGLNAAGCWFDRRAEMRYKLLADLAVKQLSLGGNATTNSWAGPSVRSQPPSFVVNLIPFYGAINQIKHHQSRGE